MNNKLKFIDNLTLFENKTENGLTILTIAYSHRASTGPDKYETMVFPLMRDGSINIDRCMKSVLSYTEDEAYLNHLKTWEKINEGYFY
jgi:hypothetical protein